MSKLKIDLQSGILEVEGEETFVREMYQDFKGWLPNAPTFEQSEDKASASSTEPKLKKTKTPKPGGKRKESYSIIKNLDLAAKDGKQSLKDFFSAKSPSTVAEKNTVFAYYLEKIRSLTGITTDHIYTCYKDVGTKVPGALRQSLFDTSSKKGWIDTKSRDNITVTTNGENLVEHELPRSGRKAKE